MLWKISLGDDGFRFLAINLKVAEISCYTVLCTPYPGCQQAAPHGGQAWLTNEEWSSIWAGLVAHHDGIPSSCFLEELLELSYPTIDAILSAIILLGRGCMPYKRDLQKAHRQPHRSTWLSFTRLYMGHVLGESLHLLGLEESSAKSCPPSPVMSCLSIELITLDCTLSVDSDRLAEIESLLHSWLHKRTTTKTSLQSLVGKLVFASKCVRQSRVFVAQILRLLRKVTLNHNHINLNSEFRKDI